MPAATAMPLLVNPTNPDARRRRGTCRRRRAGRAASARPAAASERDSKPSSRTRGSTPARWWSVRRVVRSAARDEFARWQRATGCPRSSNIATCCGRRADELRHQHPATGYRQVGVYAGRSSRARSLPTCRCCRRPSSSWSSTSRPRNRSASTSRRRCSRAPTR